MDQRHRISFWLALLQLYNEGYLFVVQHLPYVFEAIVVIPTTKRLLHLEYVQGVPGHLIKVCSDLARALMTIFVFLHNIVFHDF